MTYKFFNTKTEAVNYIALANMPHKNGDVTLTWDQPRELKNGQFAVLSHDGTGTIVQKLDVKLGILDS